MKKAIVTIPAFLLCIALAQAKTVDRILVQVNEDIIFKHQPIHKTLEQGGLFGPSRNGECCIGQRLGDTAIARRTLPISRAAWRRCATIFAPT